MGSTGGDKYRHVMFIIIESGMALFAVQLVRVLLVFIPVRVKQQELFLIAGNNIAIDDPCTVTTSYSKFPTHQKVLRNTERRAQIK